MSIQELKNRRAQENMKNALISAFKCLPQREVENMTIPEMKAKIKMMLKLFENPDIELDITKLEKKVMTEIQRVIDHGWKYKQ